MPPTRYNATKVFDARIDVSSVSSASGANPFIVRTGTSTNLRRDTVEYKVSADQICRIFTEKPAVFAMYQETVPTVYSEQEFWRMYIEAQYIHSFRGPGQQHRGHRHHSTPLRIYICIVHTRMTRDSENLSCRKFLIPNEFVRKQWNWIMKKQYIQIPLFSNNGIQMYSLAPIL